MCVEFSKYNLRWKNTKQIYYNRNIHILQNQIHIGYHVIPEINIKNNVSAAVLNINVNHS